MDYISSPQNRRIKETVKLRERKHRQRSGLMLIDGVREAVRALEAGVEAREAFVCPELGNAPDFERLLELLQRRTIPITKVSRQAFERLAYGERNDGVVLVAAIAERKLEDIVLPENPVIAVVEGVEKPGNLGAIIRSADAAGISAVVAADCPCDLWNPNVIRASIGTVFTMQVARADAASALKWLQAHKITIYAARPEASQWYCQADFVRPCAIVLGSEAQGLSDVWRRGGIRAIAIPMLGRADSLNVSTAAAVLFYEAWRQRFVHGGNSGSK